MSNLISLFESALRPFNKQIYVKVVPYFERKQGLANTKLENGCLLRLSVESAMPITQNVSSGVSDKSIYAVCQAIANILEIWHI